MYTKITVGYDGSDRALRGVEEAADLATGLGAALHIVTAVAKDDLHGFGSSSDARWMSDTEIARDMLTNVAAKFSHLNVTIAAVQGTPATVLVNEAVATNSDLIVVGNKNVQGITRILGCVAEGVAQKAHCAVLLAKTG